MHMQVQQRTVDPHQKTGKYSHAALSTGDISGKSSAYTGLRKSPRLNCTPTPTLNCTPTPRLNCTPTPRLKSGAPLYSCCIVVSRAGQEYTLKVLNYKYKYFPPRKYLSTSTFLFVEMYLSTFQVYFQNVLKYRPTIRSTFQLPSNCLYTENNKVFDIKVT